MAASLLNHRYQILQPLAQSRGGKTFLAEDTQLPSQRPCVIKQLNPTSDQAGMLAQQRFLQAAAALEAASKGHGLIPDLYAYFAQGDQFYWVREWIEGQPLSAAAHQNWSEDQVRVLLVAALGALAHMHSHQIIHCDINPDHIIIRQCDQQPCLIDFGAIKAVMAPVRGMPGFIAPEQAAGKPLFASDIYSLAMTAIYLLTGRSPTEIPRDSSNDRLLWQQFAPALSTRFASILMRAIHSSPQIRYATAEDMLTALQPPSLRGIPVDATVVDPASFSPSVKPTLPKSVGFFPSFNSISLNLIKQLLKRPWKPIGFTVGAVILGTGVILGLQSQLSLHNSLSQAGVVDIGQLKNAVKENPKDSTAQVNLAAAYRESGAYDEAIAQLEPLLSADPRNAAALIEKGKLAFAVGDYSTALGAFDQAIAQTASNAEAFNMRGDTYYEMSEYDKAVADYRRALSVDAKNGQAYINWSAVNSLKGNPRASLQNLNKAIENAPGSISAYVNRGLRKADLNDYLGAAKDWQQAISMPVITADEHASRGYAKSRMGDTAGAIADYDQALMINPKHVRTYVNRAALFYEQGEKEQTLNELEKALAINPNAVTALIFKGEINAFKTNPDWDAALAAYNSALAVSPNDPDVLNNRCGAYFATQQLDLALTDCDRGLRINPRSASLYNGRGNIRLNQDNFEGAIQDYSRAIDIYNQTGREQNAQGAYSNRASARFKLQDLSGALADINQALALKPDAPEDHYKRGLIKIAQKDRSGGSADIRKAADLYRDQGQTESHQKVLAMMAELGLE